MNTAKQKGIMWTTYNNLKMWFTNWEKDLVKLGFAHNNEKGVTIIPNDQFSRILNIDKTCLLLDGSSDTRGGRNEVVFFDPRFPQLGKGTSKRLLTSTMITGSTAAGKATPPHFQFPKKA